MYKIITMKARTIFISTLIFLISCSEKKSEFPTITISTNYGDIKAELYSTKAPKTVAAFLSYIDKGFYKNTTFYRVLKDEEMPTDYNSGLIQGGVWPNLKSVSGIEHESTKQSGLSHTSGTLSMARTGVGTATTEFFICIGDKTNLDAGNGGTRDSLGFAAFGKVTMGMSIVRKIQATRSTGDQFNEKIKIANIEID